MLDFLHQSLFPALMTPVGIFHPCFLDSNLQLSTDKFRGQGLGVRSSQMNNCCKTRSSSLLIQEGFICAFCAILWEKEQQQIPPLQNAVIKTAFHSWTLGDQDCKHLIQGCSNEPTVGKTQLDSSVIS